MAASLPHQPPGRRLGAAWRTALAIAAVGGLLVAAVAWALDDEDDGDAPPQTPDAALTVRVVRPAATDWVDELRVSGPVHPWQEAVIGAEVAGLRVIELQADVGDRVRRGQTLVRFDASTLEAEAAEARAAVAHAQAKLLEADNNAERARRLEGSGALSRQAIDAYLVEQQLQAANLASARAALQSRELRLKQVRVPAPDDGVIASRAITLGAVPDAGDELFRLIRQGRLEWRAELAPQQLARVRPGMEARLELPDGSRAQGFVERIEPVLGERNRTAIARVVLEDGPARAGMYASGVIRIGERRATTLPASAVVTRDGVDYVFVVDARSRVEQRRASTGTRRDARVEVLGGVAGDARVVAEGAAFLDHGETVQVAR